MNDAEKEVLKFLENQHNWVDCDFETIVNIKGAISIIINQEKVIENQKQEIEELKKDNSKQWEERCRLTFELENKESDLYEANNRIVDLMDIIDERDKIINLMAEQLTTPVHGIDWVIDYFTKKVEGK